MAEAPDSGAGASPAGCCLPARWQPGCLRRPALVAALYLARGFFVPLLIGILASYALHPLVDRLQAWRVPRSIGAALVLALVVGGFSWIAFSLSDDATAMIEKLPDAARQLRKDLRTARPGAPTACRTCRRPPRSCRALPPTRERRRQTRSPTRALRVSARAGARTHLAARLHARAIRVAGDGRRADADRPVADLFPARLRRAFPAQAGAARRAVAVAQEGCRAHPR